MTKKNAAKKPKRKVLGRGLDAFLPEMDTLEESPQTFFLCDTASIRANPYQPRKRFSEEELAELAESIGKQGVIQPLVVRRRGGEYELVAGERRLRASKQAGLAQVPVVVVEVSDEDMLQMTIVENVQREDLNPMEEAVGYHRLVSEFGLTQEEVAQRVGKKRPTVANFLRLLHLPRQIQDSISETELSMGHARALLGLANQAQQMAAFKTVILKKLSVRETEALVDRIKSKASEPSPSQEPKTSDQIYITHLAEELSRSLGTKVKITRKGKRGSLRIDFYADEDLDRLVQLLRQA